MFPIYVGCHLLHKANYEKSFVTWCGSHPHTQSCDTECHFLWEHSWFKNRCTTR